MLLLALIVSLPIFSPEMPHGSIVCVGTLWVGITAAWFLIRYFLFFQEPGALRETEKDARIQFIREQLDFSKLLLLGLIAGYAGLLVAWYHEIHTCNRLTVTNAGEAFLLDQKFNVEMTFFSFFYLFGPIFEAGRQRRNVGKLLLEIRPEPPVVFETDSTGRSSEGGEGTMHRS